MVDTHPEKLLKVSFYTKRYAITTHIQTLGDLVALQMIWLKYVSDRINQHISVKSFVIITS